MSALSKRSEMLATIIPTLDCFQGEMIANMRAFSQSTVQAQSIIKHEAKRLVKSRLPAAQRAESLSACSAVRFC